MSHNCLLLREVFHAEAVQTGKFLHHLLPLKDCHGNTTNAEEMIPYFLNLLSRPKTLHGKLFSAFDGWKFTLQFSTFRTREN
jgi:hypothetical protein